MKWGGSLLTFPLSSIIYLLSHGPVCLPLLFARFGRLLTDPVPNTLIPLLIDCSSSSTSTSIKPTGMAFLISSQETVFPLALRCPRKIETAECLSKLVFQTFTRPILPRAALLSETFPRTSRLPLQKKRTSYKSALAYETGPLAEGARRGQMHGFYPHKVIFFLHSTSSSKFLFSI